ncbi:MAG: hypothetical protein RL328_2262, partial [Acidobacteriota bacterium]
MNQPKPLAGRSHRKSLFLAALFFVLMFMA